MKNVQDFQSDEEINDENVTIAEKLSEERENRNLIEKIKRIVSDPKAMKKMIKVLRLIKTLFIYNKANLTFMKASQIFSIFLRIKLRKTGKTQRNFNQCPDLGSTKITIRNQEKVYVKTLIFQKKSFEKFFKFNSISEENLNSTGNDGNLLEFGKSKPKKNPEFEV